ncbi:MAG: SH3 domain-containing protein [Pseudorhizobium sp.]
MSMSGLRLGRRLRALGAAGVLFALMLPLGPAMAADAQPSLMAGFKKGRETGFQVPRYVSLKARQARMRVGPSTDYPTKWLYTHPGMPLEITEEYGNWRRVRDHDGVSGWMSGALLSGERSALVGPWLKEPLALHGRPAESGRIIARLEPKVMMGVRSCDGSWCAVSIASAGVEGFVDQASLYGVYPGERFE